MNPFLILQVGGPGKKDTFKTPKLLPVPDDKKVAAIKKKEMKDAQAAQRAEDKKAKLLQKADKKKAEFKKKMAANNATKENNKVPESPANVVRRIATAASKIKYAATLASERPEIESNQESSNSQVATTSVPKEHPLLGVINEGNCRLLLALQRMKRYPTAKSMLSAPEDSIIRAVRKFSTYDAYDVKSLTSECLYTVTVVSRPPKAGDIVKGKVVKCSCPDFKYNGSSLLCKHGIYIVIKKVCH